MQVRDVQRLLSAAGYYSGLIDGQAGEKTMRGVELVLKKRSPTSLKWSRDRQLVAAAQVILTFGGWEPGKIDGYAGNNTMNALAMYDFRVAHGVNQVISRPATSTAINSPFPSQSDCVAFYGAPGAAVQARLKMFDLPVAMRLDWALDQKVKRVQLHEKCGASAIEAVGEIVKHYGEKRWRELGLDRHAGTYVHRKMRGGTSWSMHAFGCAWDFYAAPNGLMMRAPDALFSGEQYKSFFDIWENFGWLPLGRAIGRDWMHVQATKDLK